MNSNLAIGVDDFKTLREKGSYFVDKSLFVKELFDNASDILLFPRPRRFGKTLNMSMLKYFFSIENAEENRKLFSGLAIEKTDTFEKHQGKYPVIFLSLKSCKGKSFEDIFSNAKDVISKVYQTHGYLLDILQNKDEEYFNSIINQNCNKTELQLSILNLCHFLNKYHNKKSVVLIDEYDTLIHEAYLNNFYDEAVNFLKAMLGNALKGNLYLQKAALTGILRISKESMFSDLNNLKVYSVLSEKYNSAFGFTQTEVDTLLQDYNLADHAEGVKSWYNGYYFGNIDIYNPWSIINFVDERGRYNNYWINTSSNDLVHSFIRKANESVKQKIGQLINNEEVYSVIDENISFKNIETSAETIISFFLQTGYLKAKYVGKVQLRNNYKIEIPNNELRIIYQDVIKKWFDDTVGSSDLNEMLKALVEGEIEIFEEVLNKFVCQSLSYFNLAKGTKEIERIYQAFILGLLINLQNTHDVTSEKESGYGRYDIAIIPNDKSKRAVIMELKRTRPKETTEQALDSALKQIEDRQYEAALRQQGCENIMKIAVTFDGKRIWTKEQ
ncbi:MAG: AAA family ATPase [Salinivirgaceae bacterium]